MSREYSSVLAKIDTRTELIKMQEQIMAVQRMQEYIEAHLDEEITLGKLAEVSHYSPWHSYRLFREQTGLTPSEYKALEAFKVSSPAKVRSCQGS